MKTFSSDTRLFFKFVVYIIVTFSSLLTSCDSSDDTAELLGDWMKQSDYAGIARSGAVGFVIDDKAYVGTGYDGENRLKDFWQFDPAKESWVKRADFPGVARSAAVGFAANGKGYVGTGYDGLNYLKDFWEYDPGTNTWTQIADFPASPRYGALALSINEKGYVGAGYDGNYLKDFWQYDPITMQWNEKVGLGGAKRLNAFAFTLNGKGYVGGGVNNGLYETDFLEYNPETDAWKRLKSLNETDREDEDGFPTPRAAAVTFTINGKAYLSCGTTGALLNDVWEYDSSSDLWEQKGLFDGSARESAIGFAIGNYGYITTGNSSGFRFDDLWQLNPTIENDDE